MNVPAKSPRMGVVFGPLGRFRVTLNWLDRWARPSTHLQTYDEGTVRRFWIGPLFILVRVWA